MKKYIKILEKTTLFRGVTEDQIVSMLSCLDAQVKEFKKGEYIFSQGQHPRHIVIIVEGVAHIQSDDYWGKRSIVTEVGVGQMLGEAYISPESGGMLNDVIAIEDTAAMFFDIKKVINVCPSACPFHTRIIENLLFAISDRNRHLVYKLGHMSQRTTREKLISYLTEQARRNGSDSFDIPFNRQQLADFLSVDRSAMSNELCKMRNEGLLEFNKNHFRLIL